MKPIRVLQIVTSMNMGGIENFIMNHYRNIDRNMVQFDFLKHRDTDDLFDNEIRELGGNIYSVPAINPLHQKSYDNTLKLFFNEHNYKIVHSHINTFSAYPLKVAKECGIPVRIAHSHAVTNKIDLKTPFRIYTKSVINKYATDAYACSVAAGKWLFGDRQFTLFPNAIDVEKFLPNNEVRASVRKELDLEGKYVICMVANFSSIKNHSFIINVFGDLLKQRPNARLMLIGNAEGNEYHNAVNKVKELGISDNVLFLGLRNDTNRLLQAADVFVLPSISEGFPISTLEAECSGLPCILSTGVPRDIKLLDKLDTFFVELETKQWVEKLLETENLPRGILGREILKTDYNVKNSARKLADFYISKY